MASINTTGSAGSPSRLRPQQFLGTPLRVFTSFVLIAGLLAWVLSAVAAQEPSTPAANAAATPSATPSVEMPRVELTLEEANESDLGGTVSLFEFGDLTIVEFAVTGAGGDHPAVILPGVGGETTETTDDTRYSLEPISNTGQSITTVDAPLADLLAEDHVVEIRMSVDDPDTVIACALIEGEPTLASAGTPVASPSAATPAASPSASPEVAVQSTGVGGQVTDVDGTSGAANPTADTLTIDLVDWSDTGITGTAVLSADGSATNVSVTISGDGITGGHQLHIHNGTCASPGTATYTLNPIAADGTSTSTVNLSLDQLTSGSYFINVHPDEANWDAWMVCGNITGTVASLTAPVPTAVVVTTASDGSTGGNTTMVTTSAQAAAFPQTVGVGDGLVWPSDTRTAVIWAIAGSSIVLLGTGMLIRAGERSGKGPRFTRLGL